MFIQISTLVNNSTYMTHKKIEDVKYLRELIREIQLEDASISHYDLKCNFQLKNSLVYLKYILASSRSSTCYKIVKELTKDKHGIVRSRAKETLRSIHYLKRNDNNTTANNNTELQT